MVTGLERVFEQPEACLALRPAGNIIVASEVYVCWSDVASAHVAQDVLREWPLLVRRFTEQLQRGY